MSPNSTDEKNEGTDLSADQVNDNESINLEEEKDADTNKQDYTELERKYLRLAADFENYKKRQVREKADIIAYGNEELIKSLLNVLDNLERAIEHSESKEDAKPLLEGVKLVHKQFISSIEAFGVELIKADKGTDFDPSIHQAIEQVESGELASGVILSQMQRGYMLKSRLLRPALVTVSKNSQRADTDSEQSVDRSGVNDTKQRASEDKQ